MNKKQKSLGNKGFSLVELIIVIAIMAILAGALAPQLMRYIDKSRKATDDRNCEAIKSAVEVALAEEKAFASIPSTGLTFTSVGGVKPTFNAAQKAFEDELALTISSWPKTKVSNVDAFQIAIDANMNVKVTTIDAP